MVEPPAIRLTFSTSFLILAPSTIRQSSVPHTEIGGPTEEGRSTLANQPSISEPGNARVLCPPSRSPGHGRGFPDLFGLSLVLTTIVPLIRIPIAGRSWVNNLRTGTYPRVSWNLLYLVSFLNSPTFDRLDPFGILRAPFYSPSRK